MRQRLGDLTAVVASLPEELQALPEMIFGHATDTLSGLVTDLLRLRAAVEGALVCAVMESAQRGVIAASDRPNVSSWLVSVGRAAGAPITVGAARDHQVVAEEARTLDMAPLRKAVLAGAVPVSLGRAVATESRKLRDALHPDLWDTCQAALIEYASAGATPAELAEARDAIISNYGEQGELQADHDRKYADRALSHFRINKHGLYQATLILDPVSYATVRAALDALTAPQPGHHANVRDHARRARRARTSSNDDQSGSGARDQSGDDNGPGVLIEGEGRVASAPDPGVETPVPAYDERTPAQRRADALIDLCTALATRADLDLAGAGTKAQLVISMDFEHLRDRIGYGLTLHGQPLAPDTVRRVACDARVLPLVLGSDSQPLDLGRNARLAGAGQVAALRHRDQGCSYPGCDRPPSWCDAHHLRHWIDDGPTDLTNMALLCRHHHTVVHRRGLTASITPTGVIWYDPGPRHTHDLAC